MVGEGFALEDRDNYVYDRLVANELNLDRTNIAVGGSSNYLTFMRTVNAVLSKQFDIVVTQWSALNRVWFFPGPDAEFFVNSEEKNYQYRDFRISKKEHKKLKEQILLLNHDYHMILDLIDYCSVVENLCKLNNIKCIFINGSVPWTPDLFDFNNQSLYNHLSKYSKDILDFDYRSDDEINNFLKVLKNKFKTLNQELWINLFEPFNDQIIDLGPVGHHAGVESNKIFANQVKEFIINKNLVDKDNQ
jgi:hypothetical protein